MANRLRLLAFALLAMPGSKLNRMVPSGGTGASRASLLHVRDQGRFQTLVASSKSGRTRKSVVSDLFPLVPWSRTEGGISNERFSRYHGLRIYGSISIMSGILAASLLLNVAGAAVRG
jgi:hypothetical protein